MHVYELFNIHHNEQNAYINYSTNTYTTGPLVVWARGRRPGCPPLGRPCVRRSVHAQMPRTTLMGRQQHCLVVYLRMQQWWSNLSSSSSFGFIQTKITT
jgi:hypothetical protein